MLGIIPSWQFNPDPRANPALTPFVQYPTGMTQVTVQPVGPYYSGAAMAGIAETTNAAFDSWWWRHRQAIVIGGVVAIGASILAAFTGVLR
jgi:hypothetical protein